MWCEVELNMFARADFVLDGDRLKHTYHIPDEGLAHFADGFGEKPESWAAPVRLSVSFEPDVSTGSEGSDRR